MDGNVHAAKAAEQILANYRLRYHCGHWDFGLISFPLAVGIEHRYPDTTL
jgi:hypothetical protein